MKGKIYLAFSGGVDSTASLIELKKTWDVLPVFFNYGQHSLEKERGAAKKIVEKFGLPFKELTLGGFADTLLTSDVPELDTFYLPGRNIQFILELIKLSIIEEATPNIALGVLDNPAIRTFPDARVKTIELLEMAFTYAFGVEIRVVLPVVHNSKAKNLEIVGGLETWSCYYGKAEPCGECPQCLTPL